MARYEGVTHGPGGCNPHAHSALEHARLCHIHCDAAGQERSQASRGAQQLAGGGSGSGAAAVATAAATYSTTAHPPAPHPTLPEPADCLVSTHSPDMDDWAWAVPAAATSSSARSPKAAAERRSIVLDVVR